MRLPESPEPAAKSPGRGARTDEKRQRPPENAASGGHHFSFSAWL